MLIHDLAADGVNLPEDCQYVINITFLLATFCFSLCKKKCHQ